MHNTEQTKRDICEKLNDFSENDLHAITTFLDFLHYRKAKPPGRKLIQLEGILKNTDIQFLHLADFRKRTWENLEREFEDA